MIYKLKPNANDFRRLTWNPDWTFDEKFRHENPIVDYRPVEIRFESLGEDLAGEQYLIDIGDEGDLANAHNRYEAGPGDCAFLDCFSTGLLLSENAILALEDIIESTGEVFPVFVENQTFFFYHCLRFTDAMVEPLCEVEISSGGYPTRFNKIVVDDRVHQETLFRLKWPEGVLAGCENLSSMQEPFEIYSTSAFASLIRATGLTGFDFRPVKNLSYK